MDRIQGKSIEIKKLVLNSTDEQNDLFLNIVCDGTELVLSFFAVSDLNLNNASYPVLIYGFEIIDNKNRGWEKHARYTVNDYEDGNLSFYCEDFDIQG